jgi:ATP-dependent Clp protease adapter protein ClpS
VSATRARRAEGIRAGSEFRRSHELPWNVFLHNDWNPINRVVYRLWRTIPDMTIKKATRVTWEAHTKGQAVAKTCHKELAELYEERLCEKGLTVSVEPAD